ncbi:hypothetical protein RYX36_011587 [Vicia faba]
MDDTDDDVATDIANSFSHGTINFEVVFSGTIRFKDWFNFQKVSSMKIACEPLSFVLHEDCSEKSSNWILLHELGCKPMNKCKERSNGPNLQS